VPIAAIGAALLSALIHAAWNAVLKGGRDRITDSFLVAVGGIIAGGLLMLTLGPLPREAWGHLALSVVIHLAYWFALFKGYDAGDLSHVYTLSRGSAPLLVTLGAALAAGEVPEPVKIAGIALVSAGVLLVGASPRAPLKATLWALMIGACISGYSLNDALGARASDSAMQYVGWVTVLTSTPMALFALWRRGPRRLLADAAAAPWRGMAVGAASLGGYGLVLWAQTFAPIGQVTALRETSVVFAALIAFIFLRERLGARRWLGAAVVAAGAGLIAFG
jgi:drug/metabolite transporter (DMT)-like permease